MSSFSAEGLRTDHVSRTNLLRVRSWEHIVFGFERIIDMPSSNSLLYKLLRAEIQGTNSEVGMKLYDYIMKWSPTVNSRNISGLVQLSSDDA